MNNTNNISAEMAYEKAKAIYRTAMYPDFVRKFNGNMVAAEEALETWVNDLKFSQGEVRLECEFNATNTAFKFGLTDTKPNTTGVLFNTEQRLNMQDSLVANEYGIYVCNPTSRIDTAYKLQTFADQVNGTFPPADAASINTTFFHNSYFKVTCNGDVVMPYRGLFNHFYTPQTQQTGAVPGVGSPQTQLRGAEDGLITLQPNLLLIGSKGYIPEIILPAALAITAGQFSRMVIIFKGVLAQNSTNVS